MKKAKPAAKAATKPKPKPKPKKPAIPTGPTGSDETAAWIVARGLSTKGKTRWNVNIALDVVDAPAATGYASDKATRFHLDVYRDEWGFVFVHKNKTSHVRRATTTFASGTDAHKLVKSMPALAELGAFVRELEARHGVAFKREHALVRSNLAGARATLGAWLATL